MKKRLLCLFLCLVTVLCVVLTGCSDKTAEEAVDDITKDASKSATTLSMWVVSEEKVDEATAASITNAVNALTKAKYKTQMVIRYFTRDEYYSEVSSAIAEFKDIKTAYMEEQNAKTAKEREAEEAEKKEKAATATEEETETNAYGLSVVKYPELLQSQVDIVYIGDGLTDGNGKAISGEEMYNLFVENGWLASLDNDLANASKKLREYVSPTLLSAAKVDGATYAVPNNNVIGEYTYMLLNKELMDRYQQQGYFNTGRITTFFSDYIYQFIKMIELNEDVKNKVIPIDATYEDCLNMMAYFWSIDPVTYQLDGDKFSVLGTLYGDASKISRGSTIMKVESLFENDQFVKDFLQLNEYRFAATQAVDPLNFFRTESDTRTQSAIKFLKGDLTVLTHDEKTDKDFYYAEDGTCYYVVPVKFPTASAEDIYGNMFGVCAYSMSVSRSMEILTYLNTNEEFRNLLQYGVKNTNYRLDDEGNVVRLNKKYMMDLYATGNAFIAYLDPDRVPKMDASIWEQGKIQNRSSLVDPLLGFDMKAYSEKASQKSTSVSIDSKLGYNLSYSTGYSKEILSQNPQLAEFIKSADEKGKNIYVYRTSQIDGANELDTYYIYNTLNKASFNITTEPINVQTVDNGNVVTQQTGVNIYIDYSSDGAEDGYELTVVDFACKKSFNHYFKCKIDGELAGDAVVTETEPRIVFDFYHTNDYSIDINQLTIPHIMGNENLYKKISDWYLNGESTPITYLLTYEEAGTDEMKYTYVILRNNMKYITDLNIQPSGDNTHLNLAFDFVSDEIPDNILDKSEGSIVYLFYYVTVTAKKSVKVSPEFTFNGTKLPDFKDDLSTELKAMGPLKKETATTDPNFVICGELDTEMIKYVSNLDEKVQAFLAGCTTFTQFKNAVTGLRALLGTERVAKNDDIKSAGSLYTPFKKFAEQFDTKKLYEVLMHAVNYQTVDVVKGVSLKWSDAEDVGDGTKGGSGEDYIYYKSPYGIYYDWMNAYGYLPTAE